MCHRQITTLALIADTLSNNSEPSRTLIPSKHERRKGRVKGRKCKKRRRLGGKKRHSSQKERCNKIEDDLFADRRRADRRKRRKERKNIDSKLALTTNQITALSVL